MATYGPEPFTLPNGELAAFIDGKLRDEYFIAKVLVPTSSSDVKVSEVNEGRGAFCERVLRALPEWFGIESAIANYAREAAELPFFRAELKGQEAGMLTLSFPTPVAAEIHVMGVLKQFHRRGVGRALLEAAEIKARNDGAKLLTVKTLGAAHPSEHYRMTREFYLKAGFLPLQELKGVWPEGNPCLILVKPL